MTKILCCVDEILTLWWNCKILWSGCYLRFWYTVCKDNVQIYCQRGCRQRELKMSIGQVIFVFPTSIYKGWMLHLLLRSDCSVLNSYTEGAVICLLMNGLCRLCEISLMSVFSIHLVINQQLQQLALPEARIWAAPLVMADGTVQHVRRYVPSITKTSPPARQGRTPCWVGHLRPSASVVTLRPAETLLPPAFII